VTGFSGLRTQRRSQVQGLANRNSANRERLPIKPELDVGAAIGRTDIDIVDPRKIAFRDKPRPSAMRRCNDQSSVRHQQGHALPATVELCGADCERSRLFFGFQ
jgi:hypothetical protein